MDIKVLNVKYFALNCKYISPSMTYEDYLIEVVNGSMFFRSKCSHLEQYHLESEQSHGENDVISSKYCMDFKLLVDQDTMNALNKNKPDVDYSKMSQGFIFVNTKTDKISIPSKNILFDLINIKAEDIRYGNVNDTIKNLLKNLKKDKNLFIYYPYEFSSEVDISTTVFERIFTTIMSVFMNYRTINQTRHDTYICIKVNTWFFIYEWEKDSFVYRDRVSEILCGNYRDVKLYSIY